MGLACAALPLELLEVAAVRGGSAALPLRLLEVAAAGPGSAALPLELLEVAACKSHLEKKRNLLTFN